MHTNNMQPQSIHCTETFITLAAWCFPPSSYAFMFFQRYFALKIPFTLETLKRGMYPPSVYFQLLSRTADHITFNTWPGILIFKMGLEIVLLQEGISYTWILSFLCHLHELPQHAQGSYPSGLSSDHNSCTHTLLPPWQSEIDTNNGKLILSLLSC